MAGPFLFLAWRALAAIFRSSPTPFPLSRLVAYVVCAGLLLESWMQGAGAGFT